MRVGIFDSGVGGISALMHFRRLMPGADAVFYADKENAPYGTKSVSELIPLVTNDITRLADLGAERVLMACCTASTVYEKLPWEQKRIAIPIIDCTAEAACRVSRTGRIGVLSTEATRRSGAFVRSILRRCPSAEIVSASAGELVTLAEAGFSDADISGAAKDTLRRALAPFLGSGIDTLILGCTHFSYFEEHVSDMLGVTAVNSAKEGAVALAAEVSRLKL